MRDAHLQGMLRQLPNLRHLQLSHCDYITDDALQLVARATALTRLELAHTRVGDNGLSNLAPLVALQHLEISGTFATGAGVTHALRLPALRWLGLLNCRYVRYDVLAALLSGALRPGRVAAAAALANWASNAVNCAGIVAIGCVPPLVAHLSWGEGDSLVRAASALAHIAAADGGTHCDAIVTAGALPRLAALLQSGPDGAKQSVAQTLAAVAAADSR